MRRILLTGKNGQVGFELCRALTSIGQVIAFDEHELDLASPDAIRQKVREAEPDIIVNAAAYTAVDRAESEPEVAMKVNGIAPGILAEEARRLGALMVHYSTDYVFDGTKSGPYTETDQPNPLSAYGRSKLAGDQAIQSAGAAHYIFRTSWVYASRGQNFFLTMLRLGRERSELKVVNDQIGAPTSARFLADATAHILSQILKEAEHALAKSGLYNLSASGATSWFGFAEAIFAEAKNTLGAKAPKLIPIPAAEYPLPALRPLNSRLDNSKFVRVFGPMPPAWDVMLRDCMHQHQENAGVNKGIGT
jgi:dTDP-4-dehydrorhamnose reductase